ncbi:unnamed protein product [Adineta ricciae]|uniref:C2H2-type domain-containing protein n=1 Tax=Adineta ricciae TaxID=249248 RepID=A0A815IJY2_ADIRI|nr:unnamed protein product [Adineta ricciae]CAF1400301.1 unnamed protein product [Adineta ricciae]
MQTFIVISTPTAMLRNCIMQVVLEKSEPFVCHFCTTKEQKKRGLPDRGVERELKTTIVACHSCSWSGCYQNYLDHLQQQHANFECIDCHERFIAENSLQEHRHEICVHRYLTCALPNCRELVKWNEMKAHHLSNKHQKLLLMFAREHINQEFKSADNLGMIQNEFNEVFRSVETMLSVVDILSTDYKRLVSDRDEMRTATEARDTKLNEVRQQSNANDERIKSLITLQTESEIELANIKRMCQDKQMLMIDNDSIIILEFIYPGAVSFSLESKKFGTSQYGYVFTLRVCTTRQSRGEYLSMFVTLHRGDFDNVISFPFSCDIHLRLVDQSNRNKHIEHILRPDLNSPVVSRPRDEKNDEYGIVEFCSMDYLRDPQSVYVKDGRFFTQVFFDFLKNDEQSSTKMIIN